MGASNSNPNFKRYRRYPKLMQELNTGSKFLNGFFKIEFQFTGHLQEVWRVQNVSNYTIHSLHQRRKIDLVQDQCACLNAICENKIMSNLSSDFIMSVKYAFQDETSLYTVTEYVAGRLGFYTKNHSFTNEELQYIVGSLILGLEYLSSKQILHRCLTPENIYFTLDGKVKIGGFIYSREFNEKINNSLDSVGVEGYMAPEILEKKAHNQTTDLYGLGILLYELSTNNKLFKGLCREKSLQKMATFSIEKNEFPSRYPKALMELTSLLLKYQPRKRIGSGSFDELKSHKWFENFDWEGLQSGKLNPLFVPNEEEREKPNIQKKVKSPALKNPFVQSLFIGYQHGIETFDRQDSLTGIV